MSAVVIAEKRCSHCRETKPLTEFYRNRNKKDGHHNACKVCHRATTDRAQAAARRADPDGFKARNRESVRRVRANNPASVQRGRDLNAARQQAIASLIDRHRDEFEALYRIAKHERDLL